MMKPYKYTTCDVCAMQRVCTTQKDADVCWKCDQSFSTAKFVAIEAVLESNIGIQFPTCDSVVELVNFVIDSYMEAISLDIE